jgi:type II secretion system protein N
VRKFNRPLLVVLGVALGLAVVVLIGVNMYVQSQGTQARIQQELSHRLGTPLHIHRISVTPWGGLKLSGITIPQPSGVNGREFLEAKSFHLRLRLLGLFARRLIIKEVSLVDPNVVWPQNAEGKWRLPFSRERESDLVTSTLEEASPLPSEPAATVPPSPAIRENTATAKAMPEKTSGAFVPEVRRVNISGGNFRFLDRSGNLVANFDGVNFRSTMRNASGLNGSVKVAKLSLRDRLLIDSLRSPLRYDPEALELSQISARAADGEVNGRFTMQPESANSPFTLSFRFHNVNADQIIAQAGGPAGIVQGKLEGKLEATGSTADANALNGTGEILLRDGHVQQYSLLVAIGQILQIEELTELHLGQAQAKYHITPGLVTIDEMILRSPNIRLSATGTVTFAGKLHLDSQLAINEKIRGQLYKPIRENFQPINEPGYSAVDFQVSGTIEHPKTNLVKKVVGRDLKDIVSDLFGGKTDRPKKKKSQDAEKSAPAERSPSPSASPETTPAATATASP